MKRRTGFKREDILTEDNGQPSGSGKGDKCHPESSRRAYQKKVWEKKAQKVFEGILQVDGYKACKRLTESGEVRLASCRAHVRRKFKELLHSGPAPIAAEAVKCIRDVYRIEREIRSRDADDRLAERKEESESLVEDLKAWATAASDQRTAPERTFGTLSALMPKPVFARTVRFESP